MLAAAIFAIGRVAHACDGLSIAAFGERDPGPGSLLLDAHLIGPIWVICLDKTVLEPAQLLNRVLGIRRIAAAGGADRTAEPGDRLGLCEGGLRYRQRRSFAQAARSNA
jgi:hypothetical protein